MSGRLLLMIELLKSSGCADIRENHDQGTVEATCPVRTTFPKEFRNMTKKTIYISGNSGNERLMFVSNTSEGLVESSR